MILFIIVITKSKKHLTAELRLVSRAVASSTLLSLLLFLSVSLAYASTGQVTRQDENASNESTTDEQQLVIEVNGQVLTGPFSLSQRRGKRIFLPIGSIAKALGDTLTIKTSAQIVEVRRQTGEVIELDLQLKQIRENGSPVLNFTDTGDINLSLNTDELMLPIEWLAALFGAAAHIDTEANVIRILKESTGGSVTSRAGESHGNLEIYNVDYDYNFNSYSGFNSHNLTLRSMGRIGNGRFNLITHSGKGNNNLLGPLRGGTFSYENEKEQRFMAGDLGTGSDLQFFSSNLRGAWTQIPLRGTLVTAFAGRTMSGSLPLPAFSIEESEIIQKHNNGLKYDTTVMGGYATFGSKAGSQIINKSWLVSAGGMKFNGANRSGVMLSAASNYISRKARLQGDFAFGNFKGRQNDETEVKGTGLAADVSGSYDLTEKLTVQGRYTYVSKNFLSPQAGTSSPVRLMAAGVSWSPTTWISTSFYSSLVKRPGSNSTDKNVVATLSLNPRGSMPSIFISHTQSSNSQISKSAFTTINASKDFSRFRAFVNVSRMQIAKNTSLNAQAGASLRLNESNNLVVTQSFGSKGSTSGTADWYSSSLFNNRLNFGGGIGYSRSTQSQFALTERLSASVRLPRETSLQVTYSHNQGGSQLQVSVRGSLFRKSNSQMLTDAPVKEIKSFGSASGRVYQDVNLNGKFDPGTDQTQSNVQIRIDGNLYATSDENGIFRIDNVKVGEHEIYMDLLSVRADLTILDKERRQFTLESGRDSLIDFRLVRTGRVTGVIWNDSNENGIMDVGEEPLTDARVVASSNRDSLSDENGVFTIGDLTPGEHTIIIDEKTLPNGMKSANSSITVKIAAGKETDGIKVPVILIPAEVKRFD